MKFKLQLELASELHSGTQSTVTKVVPVTNYLVSGLHYYYYGPALALPVALASRTVELVSESESA